MLPKQTKMTELLMGFEDAIVQNGWGYSVRLRCLGKANQILKQHELKGTEYYDSTIVAEYIQGIEERYYEGAIGRKRFSDILREIGRFVSYAEKGTLIRENPQKGSTYLLKPAFEKIADGYLYDSGFHPNTRNDARWVTHKYFVWLADHGFENLHGSGAEQIQKFLISCASRMTQNSIHDVLLHLRKLYSYLYRSGLSESDYETLLSFRITRECKIYPPLPRETIVKIIGAINRKTKRGKRDYAIMILGAELGLRACDIVNMKLTDVDWVHGIIKILQSKTSKTVVLPLTANVGGALQDYILNGRPKSKEKQIFLRIKSPHTPFKSAATIGNIFQDCCTDAEIESGKNFHVLRRSLGKLMVTGGVPVTTVAQVFGQHDINSTKKYISLDSEHLKLCALGFGGIAPIGGDTK